MADLVETIRMIAVAGPTASGKTALGVGIARAVNGEVVSCDSMQIYRSMQIATAAPTLDEMQGVPHHLIGFLDADEPYSVVQYCKDANAVIDGMVSRGKTPVLVGGTGLYMDSLIDNVTFSGGNSAEIRERLSHRAAQEGAQALLDELCTIDPEYAAKLHVSDVKRITRALEIYYTDGTTMSEQIARSHDMPSRFDAVKIGITFDDRELLYDRINRRVDLMVENGLIGEAEKACKNHGATSVQAIGHKELFPYFDGTASLDECIEHLKMQTRRYAKRQLSWFRRDADINWIKADGLSGEEILSKALEIIERKRQI